MNEADTVFSLRAVGQTFGAPTMAICFLAVTAALVVFVLALRSKRGGGPTAGYHWWLKGLTRALLLAGGLLFCVGVAETIDEGVRRASELDSTKGFGDMILVETSWNAARLIPVLAVALLITVFTFILGPPVEGPASAD